MTEKQAVAARASVRQMRWLERLFPERQFIIRSRGQVRYVAVSQPTQVAAAAVAVLLSGWIVLATVSLALHPDTAAKDRAYARIAGDYRQLAGEAAAMQSRFSAVTTELEEKHRSLLALLDQKSSLENRLGSTEDQVSLLRAERDRALDQTEEQARRIEQLERTLASLLDDKSTIQGALSSTRSRLTDLDEKHRMALHSQADLRRKVATLEGRLADVRRSQYDLAERVRQKTDATLKELEEVVQTTGLSVEEMIERALVERRGLGGPLVPFPEPNLAALLVPQAPGAHPDSLDDLESTLARWSALRGLVGRLPLAFPAEDGELVSGFGKRVDPFTGRPAMHAGIDVAGNHRSPIVAAGPGVVVLAGPNGAYGRTVEIDHGFGILTRDGHLRRVLVKVGETVAAGQKVGEMGSSGRSTGTHLHYEIHFDGRPVDPEQFVKAGRNVLKGG